jgi:hypothetical protein
MLQGLEESVSDFRESGTREFSGRLRMGAICNNPQDNKSFDLLGHPSKIFDEF